MSKAIHTMLFPQFLMSRWGYINLNDLGKDFFPQSCFPRNPLLEPHYCQKFLTAVHHVMAVEHSYGGYLEDRSYVWRGAYMKEDAVHLGIDYNVPAGTEVHMPCKGQIVDIWVDKDMDGGWGGRVIFKRKNLFVILAHLAHTFHVKVGDVLERGAVVGTVGTPKYNGNWYPHLHLQCVAADELPKNLDGYSKYSPDLVKRFPHPSAMYSFPIEA